MLIEYRGHSEFLLTSMDGTRLLTDPCDISVGYSPENVHAHAVTVSHDHYDHNYIEKCTGKPLIIREEGYYCPEFTWSVEMIPCFHDQVQGKERGKNLMAKIVMDKVTALHMGDLGHVPDEALYRKIGQVDVLFIPVGGYFTIGKKQAREIIERIQPKIVIPMHFKTRVNEDWPIETAEAFLTEMNASKSERQPLSLLRVMPQDLSEQPHLCLLEAQK